MKQLKSSKDHSVKNQAQIKGLGSQSNQLDTPCQEKHVIENKHMQTSN